MSVRTIKLLLLVALAQILLYSAFVVWTVHQYNAYVNDAIEWADELGMPVELMPIKGYLAFRLGQVALTLGFGLMVFWICIGIISHKPRSPSVARR